MNWPPSRPQPQRGPSRYGGGPEQCQPFVDPVEGAAAAARAFFPAPAGGEASSAVPRRQQQQYGGGAEMSLGHGHGQHHYHQFGVEAKDDGGGGGGPPGVLPRHSSSPPGFFSSLVVDNNGFPSARAGVGGSGGDARQAMNNKKMKSPLNFARQATLSQISEDGIPDLTYNLNGAGPSEENVAADHVVRSFSGGFSIGSWEDSESIVFSTPTGKPGTHNNDDIIATLSNYESQFSMPREMAGVDRNLQMQPDQVPIRVQAKRGCATHPRSIAERERRTRISEKLRKLQALVPNLDKQTSTADMLDLAVEYIRGMQSQLQALKEDKEKCTCRGKEASRN